MAHPIPFLKKSRGLLLAACGLAGPWQAVAQAQEAGRTTAAGTVPARAVLEQRILRQEDGTTVTFQRVAPPPATPAPASKNRAVVVPTAQDTAREAALEAKMPATLSISASVHEGGLTVLRWSCGGQGELAALSNVDFRLLTGLGEVETAERYYSLMMAVGEEAGELKPVQAALARTFLADGRPAFKLLNTRSGLSAEEQKSLMAMQVLHAYVEANRALLTQRRAEMKARALALAEPGAQAVVPQHRVTQFWPLSAAQRAALSTTATTTARQATAPRREEARTAPQASRQGGAR